MKKTTMTLPLSRKPRNPLVAAARFRSAGAHGRDGAGLRQQAGRALRREMAQLRTP